MSLTQTCLVLLGLSGSALFAQSATLLDSAYLAWSRTAVESIGQKMRVTGRVGGLFDSHGTHTERAHNYKLRATWFTPELIRASARYWQLQNRLSDDQTRALVREAESAGDIVIMVELDPNEGSGVIPNDWVAVLRTKESRAEVRGTLSPFLRDLKGVSGTFQRDYDYDVFWVVFQFADEKGRTVITEDATELELLVGVHNKSGKATWKIPPSFRSSLRTSAPVVPNRSLPN